LRSRPTLPLSPVGRGQGEGDLGHQISTPKSPHPTAKRSTSPQRGEEEQAEAPRRAIARVIEGCGRRTIATPIVMGDLPTPRATCFRPVASYRLRSAGAQTPPAEIDLKPSSRGEDCRAARGGPLHRQHRRESTPLRMRPKPRAVILERRPPPHMSGRSGHAIPHGAGMGVSLRDARGAGISLRDFSLCQNRNSRMPALTGSSSPGGA
jgi:hypothetical protein